MAITDPDLKAAVDAREKIFRRSAEISKRAARLSAAKEERDQAQAAVDELAHMEAEALSEWARAGAQGSAPHAGPRARATALRRLANAHEQARAVDTVLEELEGENRELSRELEGAQQQVRTAKANFLLTLYRENIGEQRRLEDALEVKRRISGGLFQAALDAHARIASEAASVNDAQNVAWVRGREAEIVEATNAQWREIAETLPPA